MLLFRYDFDVLKKCFQHKKYQKQLMTLILRRIFIVLAVAKFLGLVVIEIIGIPVIHRLVTSKKQNEYNE